MTDKIPPVRISGAAFGAAVNVSGTQRKLEAAAPHIVDEVIASLIAKFETIEGSYAPGEDGGYGVLDCIRHLRDYRRHLGVQPVPGVPQARSIPDGRKEAK